jgi:hypothetical protein
MIKLRNILLESPAKNKSKYLRRLAEQAAAQGTITVNQRLSQILDQIVNANSEVSKNLTALFSTKPYPAKLKGRPEDKLYDTNWPNAVGGLYISTGIWQFRISDAGATNYTYYSEDGKKAEVAVNISWQATRPKELWEKQLTDLISRHLVVKLATFLKAYTNDKNMFVNVLSKSSDIINVFKPVITLGAEFLSIIPSYTIIEVEAKPSNSKVVFKDGDKPYVAPGTQAAAPTAPTTPPAQG